MKYRYCHAIPDNPSINSDSPFPRNEMTDIYFVNTVARVAPKECADLFVSSFGHQKTWPKRILSRTSPAAILHYVVNGRGILNGVEVHGGQFFFTFPYQKYTILQNPDDPMEYYWMSFLGTNLDEIIRECGFNELVQIQDFELMDDTVRILDNAVYKDHSDKDMDMFILGQLYTLLSYSKKINSLSENTNKLNKDYNYFKQAIRYIEDNINKGSYITVSDIQRHLHISPSYCRMIFQKYSKHSPQKMILYKRFDRIRNELELTSYSIKEIAFRAGYHDQSLFSRQFKQIFSVSPVEYRKNYKNGEKFE